MKASQLRALGVPTGPAMRAALTGVKRAVAEGLDRAGLELAIWDVVQNPERYANHALWGRLAGELAHAPGGRHGGTRRVRPVMRNTSAPWKQWGSDLDTAAVNQMENACKLPVAVAGALMPDAHVGYGLPIGGVLATDNAVIPYAVGVDIACRMKLSVLDIPVQALESRRGKLTDALEQETRFGVGAEFSSECRHEVMRDTVWNDIPVLRGQKDKAARQLGTSGGGNHFVEFGLLEVFADDLGLATGTYLALLSHSGSRGTGARVAWHYSKLARKIHPELPDALAHLAWLDADSTEGREYWRAMELMGRYSSANHELIHRRIVERLGAGVLTRVENHHNFAWKETYAGRKVVVHRKGATPAFGGVLGVIPGSMATSGYVVRGRGNAEALNSAAHGAGRRMSRAAAQKRFDWIEAGKALEKRGVFLISGGLDEVPMAYKDIEEVMAAQTDLVDKVARFVPCLVKMAPAERRRGKRREKGRC